MFTGIIEALGYVTELTAAGTNKSFWVRSALTPQLKVDQSLSHNGVCLTVEQIAGDVYKVTAVQETLAKTALGDWAYGSVINLERSLSLNGRLDGHFVQGHVDAAGACQTIENKDGSYELTFSFPRPFAQLIIEKGSICVNGISLTAFNVTDAAFTVAVIPYTWEHTNLKFLKAGAAVNLEFDMIGKYLLRNSNIAVREQ